MHLREIEVEFAAAPAMRGCAWTGAVRGVEWMEWIVNDTLLVEVRKEVRTKLVDDLVNFLL